jgi:hypothetical protein
MNLAERDIGFERAGTDYVSRCIRLLAVGMIVLGVVFGVLDEYGLLPQLPAATVAHDSTANGGTGIKGHG